MRTHLIIFHDLGMRFEHPRIEC